MKSMPEIIDFQTRMAIILDSFNSRKLMFFDLIHEFPWTLFFVGNFLNLKIKKGMFGGLDCVLELLSILNTFECPILLKILAILYIPPTL